MPTLTALDLSTRTGGPEDDERLLNEITSRRCGPCQACCTAYGVKETRKPYDTRCQFQCPSGCSIYEYRPDTCRTFACAWRVGLGDDTDRPDLSGFMVTLEMPDGAGGPVYVDVLELRPGVFESAALDRVMTLVAATAPLAEGLLGGVRLYPHGLRQHCAWDPENNPAHRPTFKPIGLLGAVRVYEFVGNRPKG